jgi:hypothetical protein
VYGEDAEPFVFSFLPDVSQSPAVLRALLAAQQEAQRGIAGLGHVLGRWRAYGALWRGNREAALEKLRCTSLSMWMMKYTTNCMTFWYWIVLRVVSGMDAPVRRPTLFLL